MEATNCVYVIISYSYYVRVFGFENYCFLVKYYKGVVKKRMNYVSSVFIYLKIC
jgi:hypothetical protein